MNYKIPVIILSFLWMSCQEQPRKKEMSEAELNEHLINANRIATHKESEDINDYIKLHGWDMKTTGTGLRYHVYVPGTGKAPVMGDRVKISYTLSLMDGTVLYGSMKGKPVTAKLGNGELPNGLEEGLLMMKEGGRAKLVLPSHLGYGLTGDNNEIPPRAVLIYDLVLIEIQKHNNTSNEKT